MGKSKNEWENPIMKLRQLILGLALLGAIAFGPCLAQAQLMHLDPAKVTGPDACGECHKSSVGEWKGSHHFSTFNHFLRFSNFLF